MKKLTITSFYLKLRHGSCAPFLALYLIIINCLTMSNQEPNVDDVTIGTRGLNNLAWWAHMSWAL